MANSKRDGLGCQTNTRKENGMDVLMQVVADLVGDFADVMHYLFG